MRFHVVCLVQLTAFSIKTNSRAELKKASLMCSSNTPRPRYYCSSGGSGESTKSPPSSPEVVPRKPSRIPPPPPLVQVTTPEFLKNLPQPSFNTSLSYYPLMEPQPAAAVVPPPKEVVGLEQLTNDKCFNGRQQIFQHYSKETKCNMKFSIYIPDQLRPDEKFNALYFLSGVMCNEQNFIFKTGFQRYASEQRLVVIGPDTSPRNVDIPGDRDSWVFGRSAGWYLDALEEPWSTNYRMYSYITRELPGIIREHFPVTGKFGVCGHSMGGNGAVVCALRNPDLFSTLSVLAPSCNPTTWGDKIIYTPFLGENRDLWKNYDASEVTKGYQGPFRKILVDCGLEDEYLHLLLPDTLVEAAKDKECLQVELNMREGYNHSYFFVATYIEDHIKIHATALSSLSS